MKYKLKKKIPKELDYLHTESYPFIVCPECKGKEVSYNRVYFLCYDCNIKWESDCHENN